MNIPGIHNSIVGVQNQTQNTCQAYVRHPIYLECSHLLIKKEPREKQKQCLCNSLINVFDGLQLSQFTRRLMISWWYITINSFMTKIIQETLANCITCCWQLVGNLKRLMNIFSHAINFHLPVFTSLFVS